MSDWGRRLSYWWRLLFRIYLVWYSFTDLCMRSTANRTMFKKLPYYNGRQQMVSPQKHRSSWRSEQASYARRGDGLAKALVLYCNSLQCAIVNLVLGTGSTSSWLTQGNKEEKRCSAQAAAAWQRRTLWRETLHLETTWWWGGRLFEQLSYPSVLSAPYGWWI